MKHPTETRGPASPRPARLALLFALLVLRPVSGDVTPAQKERIDGALPGSARVEPEGERRVLIWNTPLMEQSPHKGYTIPQGAYAFERLGETTGAFEPVTSDDLSHLLPENIERYDAIVLNNSCGPWIRPTDEAMETLGEHGDKDAVEKLLRRSFLDWVRAGGGVFAYHYAIGANRHWPEYRELLGAGYDGHPWNEEVGVRVEERDHPLLAAFDGEDFRIADEIYQFGDPYSREELRVLLSLDTRATNMDVKWIRREDGDFALAWVKPYGKGRVFYCALGHRTETWWNPAILEFFLDGVQFATGDLEAPMEPSRADGEASSGASAGERAEAPGGAPQDAAPGRSAGHEPRGPARGIRLQSMVEAAPRRAVPPPAQDRTTARGT